MQSSARGQGEGYPGGAGPEHIGLGGGVGGLLPPAGVRLIHHRPPRVPVHLVRVAEDEYDHGQIEHRPAHEPVLKAGEHRQSREILRHPDRERVEDRPGKAHMRHHIHHAHPDYRVVAHGDGQRHYQHSESDGLLAHSEDPEDREQQHDQHQNDIVHADRPQHPEPL